MSEFTMTINGKGISADYTFDVINPATEEVLAECPDCTREQLDLAMEAAVQAFPHWRRQGVEKRRRVLLDCANAIKPHIKDLSTLLTREQGKPVRDRFTDCGAINELEHTADDFAYTASLNLPDEILQDDDEARVVVQRTPLGVVGAIAPWNFPIILAETKFVPALLAGNTVVLKPSPYTPLTTLKLGEILRDVLPPGVLNIVSGGDDLGAWITRHPAVRKIAFTGSVTTGKEVAHAASADLKRIHLELGGNDPAIVLPDVDPKAFAEKLVWKIYGNCGQICIAIKRLYVHEKIYQPLVRELAELVGRIKLGDGLDPTTDLGPLNNRPQLERVTELVDDARQAGARIVAGGRCLNRPGYFFPPTIVTDIAEGTRLVDEEQFGPVVPIMPFRAIDEALERANATHFGLAGSIWTNDVKRGAELAARLECGSSGVNQHGFFSLSAPFGGMKWSGIGRQNGIWGLEAFTELQVVHIHKALSLSCGKPANL